MRLSDIIRRIQSNDGGRFSTRPVSDDESDGAWLQYHRYIPNVAEEQHGRKWHISQYMTEQEIFRTAILAIETFERHELLERFLVDGRRLLTPHPEGMRRPGVKSWDQLF